MRHPALYKKPLEPPVPGKSALDMLPRGGRRLTDADQSRRCPVLSPSPAMARVVRFLAAVALLLVTTIGPACAVPATTTSAAPRGGEPRHPAPDVDLRVVERGRAERRARRRQRRREAAEAAAAAAAAASSPSPATDAAEVAVQATIVPRSLPGSTGTEEYAEEAGELAAAATPTLSADAVEEVGDAEPADVLAAAATPTLSADAVEEEGDAEAADIMAAAASPTLSADAVEEVGDAEAANILAATATPTPSANAIAEEDAEAADDLAVAATPTPPADVIEAVQSTEAADASATPPTPNPSADAAETAVPAPTATPPPVDDRNKPTDPVHGVPMGDAACQDALEALNTFADALSKATCADVSAQAERIDTTDAAVALLLHATSTPGCPVATTDKEVIWAALAVADPSKLCVAAGADAGWKTGFPTEESQASQSLQEPAASDLYRGVTLSVYNDPVEPTPICCPTFRPGNGVCCTTRCHVMAEFFSTWFNLSMCCGLASNVVPSYQRCPSSHVYEAVL